MPYLSTITLGNPKNLLAAQRRAFAGLALPLTYRAHGNALPALPLKLLSLLPCTPHPQGDFSPAPFPGSSPCAVSAGALKPGPRSSWLPSFCRKKENHGKEA